MPLGDKTGPSGEGPLTGRGVGPCSDRSFFRRGQGAGRGLFRSPTGTAATRGTPLLRQSWFWTTVILPLGTAIVHDLTSEDSNIKRIAYNLPRLLRSRVKGLLPGGSQER